MGSGVGRARWLDIARPESKAGCVVEGLSGDSFSSCLTNNRIQQDDVCERDVYHEMAFHYNFVY